jgi:hypothetical protein
MSHDQSNIVFTWKLFFNFYFIEKAFKVRMIIILTINSYKQKKLNNKNVDIKLNAPDAFLE